MMWSQIRESRAVTRVARIVHFSRANGWKAGLYRIWHGLSQGALGRVARVTVAELMAAPIAELRQLPRLPKGLVVRLMDSSDLPLMDGVSAHPGKAAWRRAAGDQCLVAVSDGRVLATEWIKLGPAAYDEDVPTLGVAFRVPPRACWLYDGKTVDADHVIGPWGAVMGRLRAHLEAQGVEVAYLQVGYHNQYSLRCHKALGFRVIGRLCCLQFGGWRIISHRPENGVWTSVRDREYHLTWSFPFSCESGPNQGCNEFPPEIDYKDI